MRNANIAVFDSSIEDVFKHWLEFIKPINHLSDKEVDIVSKFLYKKFVLEQKINDEDILYTHLFSTAVRNEIMDELDMKADRFNNLLSALRKKEVIVNNRINKLFVPNIDSNAKQFTIMFKFNIK